MTIKDIARESGYAISTVSRVLNNHPDVSEKTKKHILKVMESYDFVPNNNARRLKSSASKNIVILVKGTSNMFFRTMGEKIQAMVSEREYTDIVRYIDEDSNEVSYAKHLITDLNPLGLFFLGGTLKNFITDFSSIHLPCVLLTNGAESLGYPNLSSVCTDDISGAEAAVMRLIKFGHRKIGIIGGKSDLSYTSDLRRRGCLNAFAKAGVGFNMKTQYKSSRYSFEDSYKCMQEFLRERPDLTAIFAMSDVMAIGAIRAICDNGLNVPDDISVMGYDGIDIAEYYNPKITTIVQNQERLRTKGVEILLDCIENNMPARHETVPFSLSVGESVARVRDN